MMYVKHKLEIDLSGQAVMPRVDMVEGDQYTRQLELSLLCGGESWEIPEDVHAAVRFRKPDGTGGEYDSLPDGSPAWSASGKRDTLRGADAGGRQSQHVSHSVSGSRGDSRRDGIGGLFLL